MLRPIGLILLFGWFTAACASDPPRAKVATSERPEHSRARRVKKSKPKQMSFVPKRCARKKGECLPPSSWVKRLCDDIYPDLALHMFRPGTPWKRLYMLARAEPFNASGGTSLLGDKLERGEEVIALKRRRNDGEFQVGDNAGYDVLRWNGACATIHDGDFTAEEPGSVRYSRLEWRRLGLELRLLLEAQPDIGETYEARRKSCRGVNLGRVSADCEEYDKQLVEQVVRYVQSGAKLPKPAKVP